MKHTREFKESAIQLVLNSNEEIKTLAQDLGMNHKTLYNWGYYYKKENNIYSADKRIKNSSKESIGEENARLRKENRLLKQERDILKKVTAYFAKETL